MEDCILGHCYDPLKHLLGFLGQHVMDDLRGEREGRRERERRRRGEGEGEGTRRCVRGGGRGEKRGRGGSTCTRRGNNTMALLLEM